MSEWIYKNRIRRKDRHWFIFHCGDEFMKGKEIHHLWKDGDRCLILEKQQHRDLHYPKGDKNGCNKKRFR